MSKFTSELKIKPEKQNIGKLREKCISKRRKELDFIKFSFFSLKEKYRLRILSANLTVMNEHKELTVRNL